MVASVQLLGYEEEHGQVSAGMEDIPENHVKKGCTYASPEYLAELTQKILLEINVNEDLGNVRLQGSFICVLF